MKKASLTVILITLIIGYANAQEQLSVKQQADILYNRFEYFKSLSYYLKLASGNKNDVKLLERIADCYLNINRYNDAEEWYAKVVAKPRASKTAHCHYADVLLRNQKFELAKQQYRLALPSDTATLNLKLGNCDSAALWMKQTTRYAVNAVKGLNSAASDWGATYAGNTALIFTSDRDAQYPETDNRTGNNFFKLYQSATGNGQAKQMAFTDMYGYELANSYHLGPIALNSSADTAYITVTTEEDLRKLPIDPSAQKGQRVVTRRLQLLAAAKNKGKWTVFNSFKYNKIQLYSVGNACLSSDGKVLYFASDMPGGQGKTDIWYCEKQRDGSWGTPTNCGKTINTNEEDNFPFVAANGTLYYASKGLPGMGGYDIYSATGAKNQWSTPQNLKYPINSTSDDFYCITRDGLSGYLSSNREGGQGNDDIYSFTAIADTLPAKPILAVTPPPIAPAPPQEGFVLQTIYYDLDKATIRPDAAMKLNQLVAILTQHPNIKIELASYTDSRASYSYNQALSERRAKAALYYLSQHGILANRIKTSAYGKTHLVNNCAIPAQCTEAEHQLNRRTEFKVAGQ
ncbi:outer membrane protein OmpA-like peptidoglycan-associated protein [Mucilaginibacter gracilis]|uniref:Outer membrane protein OmpA-like peptidoglycan-associated protein n=1 Tax=Mucilaginibacter gracilis TaxID=423350 RepID=A0A495J712_9SPHI|nr:OmpA family protein [Mucilaginibacter gracilis]RKR84533.1 outer membrane protein OmpA-like peptidoglycan-associated protein [Mucilaginibacter gracilis]